MELATWNIQMYLSKKKSPQGAPLSSEHIYWDLVHVIRSGGIFKETLVTEVVNGTNHPIAGSIQRVPSVGHVDVGVRAIVGVEQAPEIVGDG